MKSLSLVAKALPEIFYSTRDSFSACFCAYRDESRVKRWHNHFSVVRLSRDEQKVEAGRLTVCHHAPGCQPDRIPRFCFQRRDSHTRRKGSAAAGNCSLPFAPDRIETGAAAGFSDH